jgi:ribosomal protein S18 acetylase RimI-like enzyme
MSIEIRRAVPADAQAIATAHVRAWQVAYRGMMDDELLDDPAFAAARLAGWERNLAGELPPGHDPNGVTFVPVLHEQVVGFANAGRETAEAHDPDRHEVDGEVYGFYLHPDAWGTGAAQLLMDACTAFLRERFTQASLFVLRDNHRARRFYERNGWSYVPNTEYSWPGPTMAGIPKLREPVIEVQYVTNLAN